MDSVGNLTAWLVDEALARGAAAQPALREGARAWTYGELGAMVSRVAGGLAALGLLPGERVVLVMRDTLEAVAALLGVIHAGAIAVPVSELATAADIGEILRHAGAVMAIVDADHERVIDEVRGEAPALREVIAVGGGLPNNRDHKVLLATASTSQPAARFAPDATCVVLYSVGSGSAPGEPRGVPHSRQTIEAATRSFGQGLLALGPADRVLSVARLSTAYGLGAVLMSLAVGAEVLLHPEQAHSSSLFEALAGAAPTLLFATPSVYGQLAHDAVERALVRPLASLRLAIAGAEGMPEQLVPRVRAALGIELVVGYGLSEAFQFVLAGRTDDPGARPGVCGRPLPAVEARLVDEDGDPVGVDEIGTLELRTASLFPGYWGAPVDAPARRADGWFTTRDRFLVDAQGYYHHCGRVDDLFKVSGKWVSPGEVERALTAHEAVWECAVIGADDEDGLIKPLAFVVTNVGHGDNVALEAELKDYVKVTLAPYKYPRWIEFVDALPRGPGGKVLRYKLRAPRRRRRAETGHHR